jgi:hypothetical protein
MCTISVVDTGGKSKKIQKMFLKNYTFLYEIPHIDKFFSSSSLSGVSSLIVLPLFSTGVFDTGGKFAAGINDTSGIGGKFSVGAPWLAIMSKIFQKIQNNLNAIIRGLGEPGG